jgi:hypothetical protein
MAGFILGLWRTFTGNGAHILPDEDEEPDQDEQEDDEDEDDEEDEENY